jgi:hypothetical protein
MSLFICQDIRLPKSELEILLWKNSTFKNEDLLRYSIDRDLFEIGSFLVTFAIL